MNVAVVMGHFRLSASGGFKLAIKVLIDFFEDGIIHHADLAETHRPTCIIAQKLK